MLQDMAAQDRVEGFVFECQGGDVHVLCRQGRVQIDADVIQIVPSREDVLEPQFRRDVQDVQMGREQGRFIGQIHPDEALPLQG